MIEDRLPLPDVVKMAEGFTGFDPGYEPPPVQARQRAGVNPLGALTWGGWHYAGNNGMRVGMEDHSGSGVDTNSGSFSWSVNIWTGNQYNYNDNMTLNHSNGSTNFNNTQATGTSTMRVTIGRSYGYSTWGSSPGSVATNANVSGAYNGSTPSHSYSTGIPARPYAPPYAPSGVTCTRNSDTAATISGSCPADAQRPLTTVHYLRHRFTGSTWYDDGIRYSAYAGSWQDTGLAANNVYRFYMLSENPAGNNGAWIEANQYAWMTPAAPSAVTAVQEGANVRVRWTNNAYVAAQVTHKIERKVGTGSWVSVATGIAQGTLTWLDTAAGEGPNTYRVATTVSVGPLSSAWTSTAQLPKVPDCWVWDGAALLPANTYVWTGSVEQPANLQVL